MSKLLRVGWIGCGRHATDMLLPHLVRTGVRLEAICDTDAGRLAATATAYGVGHAFADAASLLSHPGLDAVGMAVGPEAHPDLAIAALERGFAVFMEKPPAASVADAERVAEAAARTGRPVVLGFMKRHAVGNRIARNVITDRAFGRPLGFLGWYMTAPTYFADDPDYSGFYLHHCVHYMDLVPWLMGEPLTSIAARKAESSPGKLLLHLDLGFSSGALGTLVMGTVQARTTPMEFVQVMGDQTRIEVTNVEHVAWYRDPGFKIGDAAASLAGAGDTRIWEPNLTAARNEDPKGYAALLSGFVNLLQGQTVTDLPTIADGVQAMQALKAMIRAIATGERQALGS
jgi:myo-inositol 2-dehydrogenase/D-chiro-inositol 1-dehydrogenase